MRNINGNDRFLRKKRGAEEELGKGNDGSKRGGNGAAPTLPKG
jgi:hypothetical protein